MLSHEVIILRLEFTWEINELGINEIENFNNMKVKSVCLPNIVWSLNSSVATDGQLFLFLNACACTCTG